MTNPKSIKYPSTDWRVTCLFKKCNKPVLKRIMFDLVEFKFIIDKCKETLTKSKGNSSLIHEIRENMDLSFHQSFYNKRAKVKSNDYEVFPYVRVNKTSRDSPIIRSICSSHYNMYSIIFLIIEVLVEHSKKHISDEKAVEDIRKYLYNNDK